MYPLFRLSVEPISNRGGENHRILKGCKSACLLNLFLILLLCCAPNAANAVTACPDVVTVEQPDGSQIALRLHGDEYLSWTTTDDGYTVVRNDKGFYVYAIDADGGKLMPGKVVAHSLKFRNDAEKAYLTGVAKNKIPAMTESAALRKAAAKKEAVKAKSKKYDYKNFRGLVLLVEFNDRAFIREDAVELFGNMINAHDYDGFMTDALIPEKMEYTGSVRDYFFDNSMGLFDPHFDVVGPIKIDYSQYDVQRTSRAQEIVSAVCAAADEKVDFSQYDTDDDGTVDMFYIIFAGGGSNFSGNDSRLVWPHASTVMAYTRYDGVRPGRYACSTELYGRPETRMIDGIGTVCHEFSHVLGLADEYDTDSSGSGGESIDPGRWSLMASGSYLNYSRTPAGYSLFERYQSGFATPVKIESEGDFSLESLSVANTGYRIDSAIDDEYFLIENRRQTGWDEYLPGEGMLVFRVDSTNVSVWDDNDINVNPTHNYYELLRAKPQVSGSTVKDSDGDPFPGSGNITELTNETTPNFRSWTQIPTDFVIKNIAEAGENITFSVVSDLMPSEIEDFEAMPVADGDATGVAGKFCSWDFADAAVTEPGSGLCNGTKAVAIDKKGTITTSEINGNVQQWEYVVHHPDASSPMPTIFRSQYSLDGGKTWKTAKDVNGAENISIEPGKPTAIRYNLSLQQHALFRITEFTGSSSFPCYVDDVTFRFDKSYGSVNNVVADGSLSILRSADAITVKGVADGCRIKVFTAGGVLVADVEAADGMAVVSGLQKGFYIVTDGLHTQKTVF